MKFPLNPWDGLVDYLETVQDLVDETVEMAQQQRDSYDKFMTLVRQWFRPDVTE